MKTFSKLLAIFAPFLCCCVFSACSTINTSVYIYADGSITQAYEISLQNDKLTEIGINTNELLDKIDTLATQQWENASSGKDLSNITFNIQKGTNSRLITISYASYADYTRFYQLDNTVSTPPEIEEGIFFNKRVVQNGTSPYTKTLSTTIFTELSTFVANNYFGGDTTQVQQYFKDITVGTTYVYPTSYRTSSNATYHQMLNGYDIHIWQSTLEQEVGTSPQSIQIWQTYYTNQNRMAWYLTAIGATMVFGIILFCIFYFKNKNTTQKTSTTPTKTSFEQSTQTQLNTNKDFAEHQNEEINTKQNKGENKAPQKQDD